MNRNAGMKTSTAPLSIARCPPCSLRPFLQDRRGAVAPMFALAVIPVVGFVGMAVDYSRANSIRTGMQAALDATALAMSKSRLP